MNETMELTEQIPASQSAKGGKFLTFQLLNEEYGLEILKVREIIGVMDITTVPKTPDYVKGVINLRGQVIPVIDLRLKFGLNKEDYDRRTCIIVVDVNGLMMGIVVDTVSEVLDIDEGNVDEAPSFGTRLNTEYILGMGKVGDRVKILIDIGRVLAADERAALEEMAGSDEGSGVKRKRQLKSSPSTS